MTRPVLRAAKFGDIPKMHAALREAHERSTLSHHPMNDKLVKAQMTMAIQRHGGHHAGSYFAAVVETEAGDLDGFIIGLLQPLYLALDVLEATDQWWIAREGANTVTATRLVRAFHAWARKAPDLALIRQANSDIIVDPTRSGRLLTRAGMRKCGHVYEWTRTEGGKS